MSFKIFFMSLTPFRVGQFNISFTFSFFILILSGPITTPKNSTFLIFHLYFSGFTYRSFYASLFITSSTISSCSSSSSIPTIILLMKLTTFPVLIKSLRISFIIVWNIARKFVSSKSITVGSNDLSRVVNATFYLSFSFIHTLLYFYYKSIFINTFFILIFSTISEIGDKG